MNMQKKKKSSSFYEIKIQVENQGVQSLNNRGVFVCIKDNWK